MFRGGRSHGFPFRQEQYGEHGSAFGQLVFPYSKPKLKQRKGLCFDRQARRQPANKNLDAGVGVWSTAPKVPPPLFQKAPNWPWTSSFLPEAAYNLAQTRFTGGIFVRDCLHPAAASTTPERPSAMRMIGSMPTFRFSRNPGFALLGLVSVFYLAYRAACARFFFADSRIAG